jgi:plasmid stabilization system protein ParE
MLPVKITHRARAQIEGAARWWVANRPKARQAFAEDLRSAFDLVARQPEIGGRAAGIRLRGVRRMHLSRIRYHLYYRVRSERIEVLALWHSSRGEEPDL